MDLSFEKLVEILNARIEKVEFPKGQISLEKHQNEDENEGLIRVKYANVDLARFHYMRYAIIGPNGKLQTRTQQFAHIKYYEEWYQNHLNRRMDIDIAVNEMGKCDVNEHRDIDLSEILDEYLPIGNEESKKKIKRQCLINKLDAGNIIFDTINKVYVIQAPEVDKFLETITEEKSKKELYLYKYVSFNTLISMVNNKTFRMNSVVAMNDRDETLWTSQITQPNYIDEEKYKGNVIDTKHMLLTSLTDKGDDATMWRLYTNNGCGACLMLKVPGHEVTKVRYVDNKKALFGKLHNISRVLNINGIRIKYDGLDKKRLFIKSSSYEVESEYRYKYIASDENLPLADYNGLLSPYKDFKFNDATNKYEGLPFELTGFIIGRNIPNFDTNEPLLFSKIHHQFSKVAIYDSEVDSIR